MHRRAPWCNGFNVCSLMHVYQYCLSASISSSAPLPNLPHIFVIRSFFKSARKLHMRSSVRSTPRCLSQEFMQPSLRPRHHLQRFSASDRWVKTFMHGCFFFIDAFFRFMLQTFSNYSLLITSPNTHREIIS